MGKPVNECFMRNWENNTKRKLCIKLDENGEGVLETPGLKIGMSSSKDVAKLKGALHEAMAIGKAEFKRSDGRPLNIFKDENGGINIKGVGDSWIHLKTKDDVEALDKILDKHFKK